jgi:hypothetical protein
MEVERVKLFDEDVRTIEETIHGLRCLEVWDKIEIHKVSKIIEKLPDDEELKKYFIQHNSTLNESEKSKLIQILDDRVSIRDQAYCLDYIYAFYILQHESLLRNLIQELKVLFMTKQSYEQIKSRVEESMDYVYSTITFLEMLYGVESMQDGYIYEILKRS